MPQLKLTQFNEEDNRIHDLTAEISKDELKKMYCQDYLSKKDIARKLCVSYKKVKFLFDKYNIETRSPQETKNLQRDTRYREKEFLEQEILQNRNSILDVADKCGCTASTVRNWMGKHDIRKPDKAKFRIAGYNSGSLEYPMITNTGAGKVLVHRLILIAEGKDPKMVFGNNKWNVHHKNGHKCDNRPSNLELVNRRHHGKKHAHKTWETWSNDDLEFAIKAMLNPTQFMEI